MASPIDPFKAIAERRQARAAGELAQQQTRAHKAPAPGADTLTVLLGRLGLSLADFGGFLIRLAQSPLWQGVFVDVTLEAGKTEVTVEHGLGRVYRGAFVVLTMPATPADEQRALFVKPPADDKRLTVFVAESSTRKLQSRLWVFG